MIFEGKMEDMGRYNSLNLAFGTEVITLNYVPETNEKETTLEAHQFHNACLKRIRYEKKCEGCGKVVSQNEIVLAKGEKEPLHEPYTVSEFEKFKYKRKCELVGLTEIKEIPHEFVNKVIALIPAFEKANKIDEKKFKSFEKLLRVTEKKAIVTKIVLRNRERNAIITRHPQFSNLLRCYVLNYADEVKNLKNLNEKVGEIRQTIKLTPFEIAQINSIINLEVSLNESDLEDKQKELVEEFLKARELREEENKTREEKDVLVEMIKVLKQKKEVDKK